MIFLHNTLTNKKEEFKPLVSGHVSMYNCGPTVYNFAHIGNLRSFLLADTLKRVFKYNNFEVKQVMNITDVGHLVSDADEGEDKMEKGAKREGKSVRDIAQFYTDAFFDDLRQLNFDNDDTFYPKATDTITEQIALIKELERKGFTYLTSDGVYFDTAKFPAYGKLGNIDIKGLREGARVETNSEKRNPTDFALWKFFQGEGKREQEWESPWGIGYPGWHIECSAMAMKYLGETFDIHTGGVDHIPVHHNNEIAQSEAGTGKLFARYWLHGAFINVEGGKMAKSDENFLRLQLLIDKGITPLAYRLWLLGAHYSSPMNYSDEAMTGAQSAYEKLINKFTELGTETGEIIQPFTDSFLHLINDDLDTPKALALFYLVLNDSEYSKADRRATLLDFDRVLGLNLASIVPIEIPQKIKNLVEERELARSKDNWTLSDQLRAEISELGFRVEDTPDGPKVSKK